MIEPSRGHRMSHILGIALASLLAPILCEAFSSSSSTSSSLSLPPRCFTSLYLVRRPYHLGLAPYVEQEERKQTFSDDILHHVAMNVTDVSPNTLVNETNHHRQQTTVRNETLLIKKETQPKPHFSFGIPSSHSQSPPSEATQTQNQSRPSLPNGKKPTDLITYAELESILMTSKFIRETDLQKKKKARRNEGDGMFSDEVGMPVSKQATPLKGKESGVAFPQPSVLSYKSLKWGTTVAASFCGLLAGMSILPNLWLVGAIAGGFYGYDTGKNLSEQSQAPKSAVPSFLVHAGRRIAIYFLKLYDTLNTMFFMYKTGQLSYDYYKRYAALDRRFAIQDKVDAWNARFVEGKLAFDKWEKENEVGRKVLAGLRTAWLVEERSLKKTRKGPRRSKYRLVQLFYDTVYFLRQLVRSIYKAVTGGGSTDLREFLQGLRIEITESKLDKLGSRVGAAVMAIFAVNLVGALFAISPLFLSSMAVLFGVVWPTWISEFLDRTSQFVEDTRSVGRGEEPEQRKRSVGPSSSDKSRYHFYIRPDGTKKYYRVGQPWFGPLAGSKRDQSSSSNLWPWQQTKQETQPKSLFPFFR